MKKMALLLAFLMTFSIALIAMNGCTKKESKPQEETTTEQAAPDTTAAATEQPAQ